MSFSPESLKQIKKIDFTSVLKSEGIEFKKIGHEAVTLCPWHNDSNPSLTINDDKCLCYCFVCQLGNDSIGFIRQKFGLSFSEAVYRIAEKHGVTIYEDEVDPTVALANAKKKARYLNAIKTNQEEYRNCIRSSRATRIIDILVERGIKPETSKHFGLGYAPYGFFADRITIPIHDFNGTLVGFTGRSTKDEIKPKYKNSENNEFFDKSNILYNEHRVLDAIREADCLIFVEGHFDVISLWQYGIKNVVASQGTAPPTEATIKRLLRKTKRFVLCYDADEGGRKAIYQFLKVTESLVLKGDVGLSIAEIPSGTDPDECVRKGLVDFHSLIANARPCIDWLLDDWLISVDRSDSAKFSAIEGQVRDLIQRLESPALRQFYIDKASKMLTGDIKIAAKLANTWITDLRPISAKKTWTKPSLVEMRAMNEMKLLRMYIHFPKARDKCRKLMGYISSPAYLWLWHRIMEIESHCSYDNMSSSLAAVLAVSEPYYMQQFRPIIKPTIRLTFNQGILDHVSNVLTREFLDVQES